MLYVSTHQYPYYPGTGAADEIGARRGRGFTVNLPLEAGAVDEDYQPVFAEVVVPVLRQFEPDLMIVSAGFDAHERDPLGGMRLTTAGVCGDDASSCGPWPRSAAAGASSRSSRAGYDLSALAGIARRGHRDAARPAVGSGLAGQRHRVGSRPRVGRGRRPGVGVVLDHRRLAETDQPAS